MAEYTEADIQNALADIANGILATTAAKIHGVLRTTLYSRISGSQHHKMLKCDINPNKRLCSNLYFLTGYEPG
jgi:hypothetical protein